MAELPPSSAPKTPWHIWVVGGLSFLWNAGGAADFLMTQTRNEAYLSGFTPEQLEYFYSFPLWAVITWGIATWGSLLGSLLILLRQGLAVPVLMVAFIAMILTSIQNFALSNGYELMGGIGPVIFSAVIFVVALLLWIYARAMRRR